MKLQGRIKVANSSGFGFIETDQHIDFFFHYKSCTFDWKKMLASYVSGVSILVEFDNDPDTTSGPRAKNVSLVASIGE